MSDNINIKADPPRKVVVGLVGIKYTATVPKKMLALSLMMRVKNAGNDPQMMSEAIDALLLKMFGKEVAPTVRTRLENEEDALDIDHVMDLMNALISLGTGGDPTTSPSDSSTMP